ncbi:MAG: SusC/RagA family TonB-linked outer membrane protein [Longimicrobiales bacterium]
MARTGLRTIGLILIWQATALASGAGQAAASRAAGVIQAHEPALLSRSANLKVTGLTLAAALEELARSAGVALAYSPSLLPAELRVDCACRHLTVAAALTRLLDGTRFQFHERDGQIIVSPDRTPSSRAVSLDARIAANGAFGIVSTMVASNSVRAAVPAEPRRVVAATIAGTVTSTGGGPVADATIRLGSVPLSTTTSADGSYRMTVPTERVVAGPDTLLVDRIGYASTAVPFQMRDGDIRVDVVLELQAIALDQVVVTGTAGNQLRRAQAAVVASIDASDIVAHVPVSNVTHLLEGRVPGVSIIEGSGTTGASSRINIRGSASLSLSNEPLVFVDGIRLESQQRQLVSTGGQTLSALNDLNPSDIERIEIVKGPAAATLYGADASAGVIQIITKRGRPGARRSVHSITTEYSSITPNFTPYDNYATCPAALTGPSSPNPLCRGQSAGTIVSDNPLLRQDAFRNGWAGSLQYSGSGGGENFGYYLSGGIDHEEGTTRRNELGRRSGRASFNWLASPKLSIDASFAISRNENRLPQGDQSAYGYLIASGLGSPLTLSDASGDLTGGWLFGTQSVEAIANVAATVTTLRTTPSAQVRFTPWPWWTNRVTVGADANQSTATEFYPRNDENWYFGDQANGWVRSTRSNVTTYTVDYTGTIQATFGGGRYSSDLSFGSQYITRSQDLLTGVGVGLTTNSSNLVSSAASNSSNEGFTEQASFGLFVQEQLGLDDRLFLQAGARIDRNSAFGSATGAFFLPKLGVSWVLSETAFGRSLSPAISTLRLRGAWGTTGRAPTPGASLETYAATPYVTAAGTLSPGIIPLNPGNPDLEPERGTEFEAGFDAGFLNERAAIEFTFFEKRTSDLLVRVPQPPSSGFVQGGASSPYRNIGKVLNRGIEVALRATLLDRPNLTWEAGLNMNTLHNELLSLGEVEPFQSSYRAFTPGRQLGAWFVNRIRSVDTVASIVTVSDTTEYIGDQIPSFSGSANTTVTLFRNMRLYASLDGKSGYRVYNLGQEYRDRFYRNSAEVVLPESEGGYSAIERLRRFGPYVGENSGQPVALTEVKEDYIQSGDFLRLREVSATFSLPASLAHRVGATDASITIGGRNLALWSDFGGYDPEILGTGPGNANSTFYDQFYIAEVFTTPPSRRWIARLNFTF